MNIIDDKQVAIELARNSSPFLALRDLADTFDKLSIPYAIAGSLALSLHGYHRFANDIDLIISEESQRRIQVCLDTNRYHCMGQEGNRFKDVKYDVNIDLLLSGDSPGNTIPAEIRFPHPSQCYVELEGYPCLPLDTLVELKLASGLVHQRRLKDIADVQELIVANCLTGDFAALLHPWVQPKFLELIDIIDNYPA